MAVSKRLRFEVFRRDNHTCRHCGASAPAVTITVDHVVPVTLGGTDDPENLVTACADCNAGKSSVPADAALVADVAQDALRWRRAMEAAAEITARERGVEAAYASAFYESWTSWTYTVGTLAGQPIPLPDNWRIVLADFMRGGLSLPDAQAAIQVAMTMKGVRDEFSYFIGVARQKLAQQQSLASEMLRRGLVD